MPARDSLADATLATVQRSNDAFNRHDVDAVMALMTADRGVDLFRVRDRRVAEKLSYVKG